MQRSYQLPRQLVQETEPFMLQARQIPAKDRRKNKLLLTSAKRPCANLLNERDLVPGHHPLGHVGLQAAPVS